MRTRQLTIYNDSPTFNMLSECDQIAYRQNGTIHPADEERPQGNGKYRGCGASFVRRHEIRMLQDLFLADYFAPIDSHRAANCHTDIAGVLTRFAIFLLNQVNFFAKTFVISEIM